MSPDQGIGNGTFEERSWGKKKLNWVGVLREDLETFFKLHFFGFLINAGIYIGYSGCWHLFLLLFLGF